MWGKLLLRGRNCNYAAEILLVCRGNFVITRVSQSIGRKIPVHDEIW
jgi:hypothetical protein